MELFEKIDALVKVLDIRVERLVKRQCTKKFVDEFDRLVEELGELTDQLHTEFVEPIDDKVLNDEPTTEVEDKICDYASAVVKKEIVYLDALNLYNKFK